MRKMRAGKNNRAFINSNTASTVMPTRRNGSDTNQISGMKINAIRASGQHNVNNMHQAINSTIVFLLKYQQDNDRNVILLYPK